MKKRAFGKTEIEVPIIGQGTWQIPETGERKNTAIEALVEGANAGMVHIDTAEMYGNAEEIISAVFDQIDRSKLFIVSKVLPSNASYPKTISSLKNSLSKLKLEYLDCYLLHWRGHYPLTETMAAFEKLQTDGLIKSFGVSNFDVSDLEEAVECLTTGSIACNQVLYNLNVRGIERSLIPFCQKHAISLVGYTPFGHIPEKGSPEFKTLQQISKKHECTIRQVILSFLTRLDNTFTIPKASNVSHALENAKAFQINLDESDLELIDETFPAPDREVPLEMI